MPKIENDKYYTTIDVAKRCVEVAFNHIPLENVSNIIEPSAGGGAFLDAVNGYLETHKNNIKSVVGVDIIPERNDIARCDFFDYKMKYVRGRMFIGNPPFGNRNALSVRFYKRCVMFGDYVCFILPISQYKNNLQFYDFDLIYSEDLGEVCFSDRELRCCFNIYQRPKNGLNKKPDYRLNDVTLIEHRRILGNYKTEENKSIKDGFDYAICNWGNGSLGKVPEYVGQYAQEIYVYVHNKKYRSEIINLLSYDNIRSFVSSISAKKISVMRLYKYLGENIQGIR